MQDQPVRLRPPTTTPIARSTSSGADLVATPEPAPARLMQPRAARPRVGYCPLSPELGGSASAPPTAMSTAVPWHRVDYDPRVGAHHSPPCSTPMARSCSIREGGTARSTRGQLSLLLHEADRRQLRPGPKLSPDGTLADRLRPHRMLTLAQLRLGNLGMFYAGSPSRATRPSNATLTV
jgi:hypothetical protein